jgi:hypothetical protein
VSRSEVKSTVEGGEWEGIKNVLHPCGVSENCVTVLWMASSVRELINVERIYHCLPASNQVNATHHEANNSNPTFATKHLGNTILLLKEALLRVITQQTGISIPG